MRHWLSAVISSCAVPALAAWFAVAAHAQDYPARPVTMIYPYAAGSGGDGAVRLVGNELATLWKQPVVIENRPAGSGMLGYAALQTAKPDGYLLSYLHVGVTVIRRLADPKFTADVGKDYEAVIALYEGYTQFAAHPSAPFSNVREFITYAKANPGKINIAIGGRGNTDEIAAEMLKAQLGIDLTLVYYNGSAPAVTAAVAGQTHAILVSATVQSFVDAKRLIPLAAMVPAPTPYLAGWPSLSEVGVPGYQGLNNWMGLYAPAGTPRAVVLRVNQSINAVLKDPNGRKMVGVVPVGGTPEEAAGRIRSEIATAGPIIRKLNIKFD